MLNITHHKNGLKMEKFLSINVALSDFCLSMRKNKECICSQCYAYYMNTRYPRLRKTLLENSTMLSGSVLTGAESDQVAAEINKKKNLSGLRFNSMGEIINDIHVINLQEIALKVKSSIPITLWTKRPALLFKVLDKPAFKVIYSNPKINSYIDPMSQDYRVSNTFNVYDNPEMMHRDMDQARSMGIRARECSGKCSKCMYCYNHESTDYKMAIFELTKKAQKQAGMI